MNSNWPEATEDPRTDLTNEWDVRGIDVATLHFDRGGKILPAQQGRVRSDVTRVSFDDLRAGRPTSGPTPPPSTPLVGTPEANLRSTHLSSPPMVSSQPPPAGLEGLPHLTDSHLEASRADVQLNETIGEGGMGVVWAARQVPLRRPVAVKSIHPDAPVAETTRALLREARVTGYLEHPNIIPIHALGQDTSGRPIIVMKRVDGTTWSELLERQHAMGPGSIMKNLDYHLQVLIDVAKAIHFAHSRRILHRDIKPDNVMIGGFGEVYVVDWGIALALEPVVALDLPLASQVNEIIGSPAYMAPEMAIGEGRHMSPRTDVYLLGATLHEILTGQPPHISTNPGDMLSNAYLSRPPSYDATVPYELAEIVRAAMARKPVERTASAALFAASLQRFLHHRDSLVLSREAEESQAALEDRLAVDYGLSDDTTTYALFNRARFGFEHALKIWPDNARARLNLQGTLTRMIEYELERGSPGAASALLKELPAPEPELAERVRARDEEVRRAESALDALRDKVDPTRFDRPRAYLAFAGAVSWPLCHWGLVVFDERSGYGVSHALLAGVYGLFFFASVAMGVAQRETLLRQSASGLQTQLVNTLVYAALIALWGLASRLELTVPHTISFTALVASCLFTTAAVTIDRRFLTWGLSMVGALIACLIAPDRALIWLGAGGLVGSGTLGILRFRTKRAEQTYPLSQALAPGSSAE